MVNQRKYQSATHEQLLECIRWCQSYLNLRDWFIDFYTGTREPTDRSAGWTVIDYEQGDQWYEKAAIWVDIVLCKQKDSNPYVAVCHEMIHVLVMGKCRINDDNDNEEYMNYALQDLLYCEFCRQKKKKIAPMQKI